MISSTDMNNNVKWLTSFVFALITEASSTQRKCTYDSVNGLYGAICVKLLLVEVPQDLVTNIKFLDLSENLIQWINASSLVPYSTLVEFKCRLCTHPALTVYTTSTVFTHLTYLQLLDLSNTRFSLDGNSQQLEWPLNLQTLILDNCSFRYLNFAKLSQLEKLQAVNNELNYFPETHPFAPLIYVDLRNNSVDNMTTKTLQPYCLLEYLGLSLPKTSFIIDPSNYCQCEEMEAWIKMNNIKGAIPLNCTLDPLKSCANITFSSNELNDREKCLITFGRIHDNSWIWIMGFLITVAVVFVGLFIYCLMFLFTLTTIPSDASGSPEQEQEEEEEAEEELDDEY